MTENEQVQEDTEDTPDEISPEAAAASIADHGGSTETATAKVDPAAKKQPPVAAPKGKKGDVRVRYIGDAVGRTCCWGLNFPRGEWVNVSLAARNRVITVDMVEIISGKVAGNRFFEAK